MICNHAIPYSLDKFSDNRGFLIPLREINKKKLSFEIKDSYVSFSNKNVFRGLHLQLSNPPPNKIVNVIQGSILGISVCCNKICAKFGEIKSFELDSSNPQALIIPSLNAFGYLAMEDQTIVQTLTDQEYDEKYEVGINPSSFKDILGEFENKIISKKDSLWPNMHSFYLGMRH